MNSASKMAMAIGLVIGIINAAIALLSSAGAGHGSGDPFVAPIFFGLGMFLWVLSPLTYCAYAYIAKNKLRRVGIAAAAFHYASTIMLIALDVNRNDYSRSIAEYRYEWPFLLMTMYLPFIIANVWYWRSLLKSPITTTI